MVHEEDTVFTGTGDDDVEFIEECEGVHHITHVNNILHSIFSDAELNTNNNQIYNSNGHYAHKSHISNNFKSTLTGYKGVLHCERYDYEEDPEILLEGPLFTRRMKLYNRPDGFMLYRKLGINLPLTSELPYPNMKERIRRIRRWRDFYLISENPNVSLGFVDCSLYLTALSVKYNNMEILAKAYIIPAQQNQFFREILFNNAPIRQIDIEMNSHSASAGSFAENPLRYQQFNLRNIRILRGGQPLVHHDTTFNCRLYVSTMKAKNFQDDIPSIPVDNIKDHYVIVFDLTSMHDACEHRHYPQLNGEPLRLELYFSSPLENVTEFNVLGERMSPVAVDKFGVVGKNLWDG